MKVNDTYFEIRSATDAYGLEGHFKTEAAALEHINAEYERAKAQGYDNSANIWLIVCVEIVKEYDSGYDFLKEQKTRFVMATAAFSSYENKFVFVV